MVQEIREIMLGVDELVAAIEAYRQLSPEFLPPGKITNCFLTETNTVSISIEIAREGYSRNAEFILNKSDLLRPLACFCLQNGISIPKDGLKRAVIGKKAVSFVITYDLDVKIPAWIAPMRLDRIKSVASLTPGDIYLEEAGGQRPLLIK